MSVLNASQIPSYYIKSIGERFAMVEVGTERVVFWLKQHHVTFEMDLDDLAYVQATFSVVKDEAEAT